MISCSKGWHARCGKSRNGKCTCKCFGYHHGRFIQVTLFDLLERSKLPRKRKKLLAKRKARNYITKLLTNNT